MRSRLCGEALTDRAARPSSSAALQSDRRLVPSSPVLTSWRMRASGTARPKWRATMASDAAPQSISSICLTNGMRRTPPPPLDESALGFERRLVDRVGVVLGLIDLRVADLDLRVGAGRKNLVLDALRQILRALLVGVLRRCARRAARGNSGSASARRLTVSGSSVSRRQAVTASTVAPRGMPAERRDLAEIVARAQAREVGALAAVFAKDANAALLDQEHRPGRIALTHDDLARRERRAARSSASTIADDGVRGQPREGRKSAEEGLQLAVLGLQLEIGADVRVRIDQAVERRALEAQRNHVAARANGRRARPSVEQLDFAEAVAGLQDVERNLVAVVGALDDAGAARHEDVQRVGGVAFRRDARRRRETTRARSDATTSARRRRAGSAGSGDRRGRRVRSRCLARLGITGRAGG